MYRAFYGLRESPFSPTPDPGFLFESAQHATALTRLTEAIARGSRLAVLTGEAGTGKTTVLRALLTRLDEGVNVAYIHYSAMEFADLLTYMVEDWGIKAPATSHQDRLEALREFLVDQQRLGLRPLLVIDEAQDLSDAALERLAELLSANGALLQVLLIGQQAFRGMLAGARLGRRVDLHCELARLTRDETRQYVEHRLRIAGASGPLFAADALALVAAWSEGTPRLINLACDYCLVNGYAEARRQIDAAAVEDAIAYLEDGERPAPSGPVQRDPGGDVVWFARGAVAALVLLLVFVVGFAASALGWLGGV